MASTLRRVLPVVLATAWPCLAPATEAGPKPAAAKATTAPGRADPVAGFVPVLAVQPAAQVAAVQASSVQPPAAAGEVQLYCRNIAAAAADARFAWQARQIKELQAQLAQRIQDLDAKAADYRDALAKHDAAMKRAADSLVGIYGHMKPDAAAAQLSQLDDDTAAAVISQLNPRQSSAILNEVAPERAVHLINAIAGAAGPDGKKS